MARDWRHLFMNMQHHKTEVRIIAGSLRGRKVSCVVHEGLRPTPQMVREALFSILGNAIPGRPFFDLFAGTGVVGMEAVSRGADSATLLERDAKLGTQIEDYLRKFAIADKASVLRTDAYRWAERWIAPERPVNVFFSPPFMDLTERVGEFVALVRLIMDKVANESVVAVQAEDGFSAGVLPESDTWDCRKYGRNLLLIWVKEEAQEEQGTAGSGDKFP
jgi:16S rRNA (guanine(966)-N(2))-methyltransferase RsmD